MNKILFLTDQVRDIKSGPGVFSQHLKILEKNFSVKIDFFSLEISLLGSIISGFNFSKLSGLISSMVYSLYYTIQVMQSKYDIVLVNSSYHVLFAFFLKKSILFVNDIKWTRKPKLELLLHKRSFRSAKLLVANSSFVADKLMRMFPNKKIMLIEKCVDMVVANARLRIADRKVWLLKQIQLI